MQDRPANIVVDIEPCTGLCQQPCRLDRTRGRPLPLWLRQQDLGPGEPNHGQVADALVQARV